MTQAIADQRPLEVELFHNQAGYLSDPPANYFELFNSLIIGLNDCRIRHALKTNPDICHDYIKSFWLSAKVNRKGANGAGPIVAKLKKKETIITEVIVREALKFGDQPNHPTSYEQDRVVQTLHRMSNERGYPTVLKKLFLLYWRLLVYIFLQCIAENKGGLDQLNKIQASALVSLVNNWDYNFWPLFSII
ncbi:hypothetical protein HanPI659440_Chr12g0468821 [Helianthus annuus]|nr:hypothetical protein HanPI659440_Chr12g0468821 [Helianthus annuus]